MELDVLINAVHSLKSNDAFRVHFSVDQWRTFGQYLTTHSIRSGDLLIRQGDSDKAMYFVAAGTLQVFVDGARPGAHRVAILQPGAVVGESALFADVSRSASVEAMTPCVVWALRGPRLDELSQRSPAIAIAVLRAAAAVMAVRLRSYITQQVATA